MHDKMVLERSDTGIHRQNQHPMWLLRSAEAEAKRHESGTSWKHVPSQ